MGNTCTYVSMCLSSAAAAAFAVCTMIRREAKKNPPPLLFPLEHRPKWRRGLDDEAAK